MKVEAAPPPLPDPPAGPPPDGRAALPDDLLQRFASVVKSATDYFTLVDSRFVYLAANDAYCRAHHRPREQILGHTVAEIWGEAVFQSDLRPNLQRVLAGEEIHYDAQFEFPGTGSRHFAVSLYPYASTERGPHVIAVTRDITVQHSAEEQVRLLLLLAQTVNQAPDFSTALTLALRQICRFTGWTLGQAWCPAPSGDHLVCLPTCETNAPGLEPYCAASRQNRWRRGESLPGLVWETRQALWVPAYSTDPRFARSPLARELGLQAAMAIPVVAAGEVVAVLEFLLRTPRSDDERLMGVVSATAEQLGSLFVRRRTEAALSDSEERYRALIETANDVIFFLGTDGRIAALNRAFEVVTGWTCTEWLGHPFAPLLHPEDLPRAQARLQALVAGEPPRRSEYRVRKASGDYAVGEFTLAPQLKDGRIAGFMGIGRDVTERKHAEEQLDRFFNRSLDMHCLAGFDGFLKRLNPAWEKTLGYTTTELLCRPYLELIYPADRPAVLVELARLQEGHDITAFEMRCVCKDGSLRWTLWNATPLPSQQLIIATGRDITERKRTEEAVQQSEEHYRELFHQAFQMQEKLRRLSDRVLEIQEQERTRISRDLHDEIGQALTAINVNLASVRQALPNPPPKVAQRIADALQILEQTMVTVHRFSRELRPAMLDDLGLVPSLRCHLKGFTERTGIHVRLSTERIDGVERLDSDRKTVIYRVVQEGLNNTAKHAAARQVTISIAEVDQRVRLEIQDDGRGFDSAGQAADGTSNRLGLLGISERVRLVNGEFAVNSQPGRGTLLRVTIPFKSH